MFPEIARVEISKLELKPGDTLVVSVPPTTTMARVKEMQDAIAQAVPDATRVLFKKDNIVLSVLRDPGYLGDAHA